jgi:hypothetical protein
MLSQRVPGISRSKVTILLGLLVGGVCVLGHDRRAPPRLCRNHDLADHATKNGRRGGLVSVRGDEHGGCVIDRGSQPSPRGCSASATPHVVMQTYAQIAHSVELLFFC